MIPIKLKDPVPDPEMLKKLKEADKDGILAPIIHVGKGPEVMTHMPTDLGTIPPIITGGSDNGEALQNSQEALQLKFRNLDDQIPVPTQDEWETNRVPVPNSAKVRPKNYKAKKKAKRKASKKARRK